MTTNHILMWVEITPEPCIH